MENVKVTLVKSLIACKANQIATAKTLGLKRPGDSIVLAKDACTVGFEKAPLCLRFSPEFRFNFVSKMNSTHRRIYISTHTYSHGFLFK